MRSESRALRPHRGGARRRGHIRRRREHPSGFAQGRARRGRGRPQGVGRLGEARTAYNRGQILYRFAEALESRTADIGAEREDVEASIDVLVHYAGWTDKLQPVLGGINPVAAPFLSFSVPEPTGVVGIVAPDAPPLLGLIAELAPALAAGNTVVAVLSDEGPLQGRISAR